MDLSSWSKDKDFTFACMTLVRGTNASGESEIRAVAIEKLKEAWAKSNHNNTRYIVIFESILKIFTNTPNIDQTGEIYKWWDETVRTMEGSIPEELFEIAVSLNWQTPMASQQGLLPIKSRLLLLL